MTAVAVMATAALCAAVGWGMFARSRHQLVRAMRERVTLRPDFPPAQVQQTAEVIRESAHQALEDLRAAIRTLSAPDTPAASHPQPAPAELLRLVKEQQTKPTVTLAAPTQSTAAGSGSVPDRARRAAPSSRLSSRA